MYLSYHTYFKHFQWTLCCYESLNINCEYFNIFAWENLNGHHHVTFPLLDLA